jgi:hypothetical protein
MFDVTSIKLDGLQILHLFSNGFVYEACTSFLKMYY